MGAAYTSTISSISLPSNTRYIFSSYRCGRSNYDVEQSVSMLTSLASCVLPLLRNVSSSVRTISSLAAINSILIAFVRAKIPPASSIRLLDCSLVRFPLATPHTCDTSRLHGYHCYLCSPGVYLVTACFGAKALRTRHQVPFGIEQEVKDRYYDAGLHTRRCCPAIFLVLRQELPIYALRSLLPPYFAIFMALSSQA